jgi:hypothetical protein
MTRLEVRLGKLEYSMRSQLTRNINIKMDDNRVRIDLNDKFGQEVIFSNVHEAAQWVETQSEKSEKITGSVWITDISQLYPEVEFQKDFLEVWGGTPQPILINLAGRWTNDLREMALVVCIFSCFSTVAFHQRFKAGEFTEADNRAFTALFMYYCQSLPVDTLKSTAQNVILKDFMRLIFSITKLPITNGFESKNGLNVL